MLIVLENVALYTTEQKVKINWSLLNQIGLYVAFKRFKKYKKSPNGKCQTNYIIA